MTVPEYWQEDVSARVLTSMQTGGIIRYLAKPRNVQELIETVNFAQELSLPFRALGAGSNCIFSDDPIEGVVIKAQFMELKISDRIFSPEKGRALQMHALAGRYLSDTDQGYLHLEAGDIDLERRPRPVITLGAGVPWGQAVQWSLKQNLGGLHWFARIPCSVGGAVYNNIHGAEHLLAEYVLGVSVYNLTTGKVEYLTNEDLNFSYDFSIFHTKYAIITEVDFALPEVTNDEVKELSTQYRSWTQAKVRAQPSGANCGSVFKNVTVQEAKEISQPHLAAAWYIDQCGLKGYRVGGMQVYPGHANFIVNTDSGSTEDFWELVRHIQKIVKKKFTIQLQPEVEGWHW